MSMKDESRLFKKMEDDLYREAKEERERIKKEREPYSTLTKREVFAAMAMQGMLADPTENGSADLLAHISVRFADELIKALEGK